MTLKTLFSTNTKEDLTKMINKYYYSDSYFINDKMQIEHKKSGKILSPIVENKKGRWSVKIEK